MSRKSVLTAGATIALVILVGVGAYAINFHLLPKSGLAVIRTEPRIIVNEERLDAVPGIATWGRVTYDAGTDCLFIERDEPVAQIPQRESIIWPRGTRPVTEGDRKGVRVGGFLGRFGGALVLDGDYIRANGASGGASEEPQGCEAESYTEIFGAVTVEPNG